MSWAEIKRAVNSTVGTEKFVPLNKFMESLMEEFSYEMAATNADIFGDAGGAVLVVPRMEVIPSNEYYYRNMVRAILPPGLKKIGSNAFSSCDQLRGVNIPDSVIEIGDGAFSGCSSLRNVKLPDQITKIEDDTFNGTALSSIIIPNKVETIGVRTFMSCEQLETITIPKSVTQIGANAFLQTGLANVYYKGTQEEWDKISFGLGNERLTGATIHYNS